MKSLFVYTSSIYVVSSQYVGELSTMERMVKCMLGQSEIMCIYLDLMFGCLILLCTIWSIECTIVLHIIRFKFLSPQYFLEL